MTTILKGANTGGWFLPVYLEDDAPDAPAEDGKLLVYAQRDNQGGVALLAINSDGEIFQLSTNNNFLRDIAEGSRLTEDLLGELRVIRAALVSLATDSQKIQERDLLAVADVPRPSASH